MLPNTHSCFLLHCDLCLSPTNIIVRSKDLMRISIRRWKTWNEVGAPYSNQARSCRNSYHHWEITVLALMTQTWCVLLIFCFFCSTRFLFSIVYCCVILRFTNELQLQGVHWVFKAIFFTWNKPLLQPPYTCNVYRLCYIRILVLECVAGMLISRDSQINKLFS